MKKIFNWGEEDRSIKDEINGWRNLNMNSKQTI